MLGIQELWLFIISGLLLNITPGPDTAYIIGRSVQMGWRGGAAAALGICTGCLVHVFAAAIGLSALLAASSVAFTAVKWAGAAYLCFIGVQLLLSRPGAMVSAGAATTKDAISLRQVFWQGALTNVSTRKWRCSFSPSCRNSWPRTRRTRPPPRAARPDFCFQRALWCLGVAAFAARAARSVRQSGQALTWINRTLGGLFIYLGVRVAMLQAR